MDVAEAEVATLADLEGIEADKAQAILQAAQDYVSEQAAAEADNQESADTPDGAAGQTDSPQEALLNQATARSDSTQTASEEV